MDTPITKMIDWCEEDFESSDDGAWNGGYRQAMKDCAAQLRSLLQYEKEWAKGIYIDGHNCIDSYGNFLGLESDEYIKQTFNQPEEKK